jgi:hypothetical protein
MELGKTLNLDGKAAYLPEHTYAHPIGNSFASAIGYDGTGTVVSPDTPSSGPSGQAVSTSDFRSGAR